jgi:hypothetical protein
VTAFRGPIRRVDTAKSHHYRDADNRRVPGVTTIIGGGVPKPALINWAGTATAEYAVDRWRELEALKPSEKLKRLQKARYADRDEAADRGTEVHKLAEPLARGVEVDIPDAIAGHVQSYIDFLDDFEPEVLLLEATIYSLQWGYAGTLDAIFYFPTLAQTLLCDIKTNRSGIFGETALQLAGYRYADSYVDADGVEHPMIPVDGAAAIHVRADGYSLIPVVAGPAQHEALRNAMAVREFVADSKDLLSPPIDPPHRVHRRRLVVVRPQEGEAAS